VQQSSKNGIKRGGEERKESPLCNPNIGQEGRSGIAEKVRRHPQKTKKGSEKFSERNGRWHRSADAGGPANKKGSGEKRTAERAWTWK